MAHKKHNRGKNAHTKADRHHAQKCKAQGSLTGRPFRDHLQRRCRNITYPDARGHRRQIWTMADGWADHYLNGANEWVPVADDCPGGDD